MKNQIFDNTLLKVYDVFKYEVNFIVSIPFYFEVKYKRTLQKIWFFVYRVHPW
jgi:hypothetical protein